MQVRMRRRGAIHDAAAEGALLAAVPGPILIAIAFAELSTWVWATAGVAAGLLASAAYAAFRHPHWNRFATATAAILTAGIVAPELTGSPTLALLVAVLLIWTGFTLTAPHAAPNYGSRTNHAMRCGQRARGAALVSAIFAIVMLLRGWILPLPATICLLASHFVAAGSALQWAVNARTAARPRSAIIAGALGVFAIATAAGMVAVQATAPAVAIFSAAIFLVARSTRRSRSRSKGSLLTPLLDHPARVLLSTFPALCLLGMLLLMLPAMTTGEGISAIDAAFTAVSAVCVTGLIVLDTPHDFTLLGQAAILLLIQLGGLGIMSLSTLAIRSLGLRMNMRQERVVAALHGQGEDVFQSLRRVITFTFTAELVGAILLSLQFFLAGDALAVAVWRGVFTAVSAFCNAGFALQSDSLIPYATQPLVLHTVAALIVLGGISPAITVCVPAWIVQRRVPPAAAVVLVTTGVLLLLGFLAFLILEWQGILASMDWTDKLHNAWFQSVTLRTAGFNSVDLVAVSPPMIAIMMLFMFIGGSPGGTAGGVKTTTAAILACCVWSSFVGRDHVLVLGRRIPPSLVNRAIAVVGTGLMVWFAAVIALELTQAVDARDLLFEATSALGTVGLSTGATGMLDSIGKVLIIITMFLGRVGPLTLFVALSSENLYDPLRRPEIDVPIT